MLPKWEDAYRVNNEMIDAEHKRLFELAQDAYLMANRFVAKEEIKAVLKEFFEYMRDHFSHEEEYMKSIGYPAFEEHRRLHKEIIFRLSESIQEIRSANDLKEKIGIIAKEWLLQHILKEDMAIQRYCKERAFDEEKNLDFGNDGMKGYEYVCACPKKIHRVSLETHQKIQLQNAKFICRICKQVIRWSP